MAKITINPIPGSYASVTAINQRLQLIEDAFNNDVLYRDNPVGEPNTMANDFDMGGFSILNAIFDSSSIFDASTLDGLDSTQFLRSDQSDTMVGALVVSGSLSAGSLLTTSFLRVMGTVPRIICEDIGAPLDEKVWDTLANSSNFYFRTVNDPGTLSNNVFIVTRTGLVPTTFDFQVIPTSTVAPTLNPHLTRKDYVDVQDLDSQLHLGGHAAPPTLNNAGNALVEGNTYYNNGTGLLYSWDGAVWNSATAGTATTAAAVSIADANGYYSGLDVEAALQEISQSVKWNGVDILTFAQAGGADRGLSIVGGNGSTAPALTASSGTAPNVDLSLEPKGAGNVNIKNPLLQDANSNEALVVNTTASATNHLGIVNANGSAPTLRAEGSDTDIDLGLEGKGGGRVIIPNQSCLVYRNGTNQTVAGVTNCIWDTVVRNPDIGGVAPFWSVTNPTRFTIPTGVSKVRVTTQITWSNNPGAGWFGGGIISSVGVGSFAGSGSDNSYYPAGSGANPNTFLQTAIVDVSPGDYIETALNTSLASWTYIATIYGNWSMIEVIE